MNYHLVLHFEMKCENLFVRLHYQKIRIFTVGEEITNNFIFVLYVSTQLLKLNLLASIHMDVNVDIITNVLIKKKCR